MLVRYYKIIRQLLLHKTCYREQCDITFYSHRSVLNNYVILRLASLLCSTFIKSNITNPGSLWIFSSVYFSGSVWLTERFKISSLKQWFIANGNHSRAVRIGRYSKYIETYRRYFEIVRFTGKFILVYLTLTYSRNKAQ